MRQAVSTATWRNWSRLGVSDTMDKLTKRANKTNSRKVIFPVEYATCCNNMVEIESLVAAISNDDYSVGDIMYTLAINYLETKGFFKNGLPVGENAIRFANEYAHYSQISNLAEYLLPQGEADVLGLIYQSLCIEGEKNKRGLYYTPLHITNTMVANLCFANGELFLDPCCGSGSFFLGIDNAELCQLYGFDIDPIAVMICKANLIAKYPNSDHYPHIYCTNYLTLQHNSLDALAKETLFDYICTNPPWGALSGKKESFSCFTERALKNLKINGKLNFLLPEAVLNVKVHSGLRKLLLEQYSIEKITSYPNIFTGVTTGFVSMQLCNSKNRKNNEKIKFIYANGEKYIDAQTPLNSSNFIISAISDRDKNILGIIERKSEFDLSCSLWALGIVTGNNAEKLLDIPSKSSEPIYTGKEISAYKLLTPKKHIEYIRTHFQQVAPDEMYRAKEKLAYKFISNKLVFAYDNLCSLFLNSANILIPRVPAMSVKTVMLFLNSELFQFAYKKRFGGVKILKGNLCELGFPRLTQELDHECCLIVDDVLAGKNKPEAAQDFVYSFYNIEYPQRAYIKKALYNGNLD